MEVHPPHGPIHSIKEFMVHLLAITIGLLIALGLESSVEWVHHRHLARDARENILQEVRANQQMVARQLSVLPAEEKRLDEILRGVDDVQHGRPRKPLGDFMWTSILLQDSAWRTASSTGAVAFMSYDEVQRYSVLYGVQQLNGSILDRNLADRHEMDVFIDRMQSPGKLSDAEFESGKRSILSAKFRELEFNEIDTALNASYTKLLSQEQ
jgi:hypothetical protein